MRITLLLICLLHFSICSLAQLVINEASNANENAIITPQGATPDWIEIYNTSTQAINLNHYYLTDKKSEVFKWKFPSLMLGTNQFLTILASGFENTSSIHHYETAVYPNYLWKYIIPDASTSQNWRNPAFNVSSWTDATLGLGYGDGDDNTDLGSNIISAYTVHQFNIADTSKIASAILDVDFDDGFVAYLNGIEIARAGLVGFPPAWDETASDHEALIYQGGNPGRFPIDYNTLKNALKNGANVLAIEVHNTNQTSSDLSLIPFLTFGIKDATTVFGGTIHDWFDLQTSSGFETNFTIKPEGETIYLTDTLGMIIDSLFVPDLEADMSIGRKIDGTATLAYFPSPTPSSTNNSSTPFTGFEFKPTISVKGGFYNQAITVEVTNNSSTNGIVRYSTNGQNPDNASPIYTSPITISATTVFKARCFSLDTEILPSPSATESYFFMEDFTIPVISLTTDNTNLYGADGIFDNYWTDWKKPCFVEYFDKDGQKQFDTRASIKSDGGAGGSRGNPQHSVTIDPSNSTYGEGRPIEYPLIPEKSFINEYYAFYLRNGSNMWNQYPQKDATFMRMMRETNANSQAYSPVVVFLNGDYFGVYELREKANAEYFDNNYGNNPDELDLLSISYFYAPSVIRTIDGSDTSFFNMRDFVVNNDKTAPDYFEKCHEKIDLYNFSDYLIGENWFANYDWIYNNMKIFRTREKGNRWRFNLQDMEIGLGSWSDYNADLFDYLETQNLPNPFNEIYMGLIQNTTFKNYHLNRYADLMNTIFQAEYYLPLNQKMYQELLPEMPRHFQRWTGDVAGGMATYDAVYYGLLDQFQNRNAVVRDQIVSRFNLDKQVSVTLAVNPPEAGYIKISTIVPKSLPWTGIYFDGVPVEITAVANPGFEFVNWDANSDLTSTELTTRSLLVNIDNDNLFKANFTGNQTTLPITISEINYNSDASINGGNWIELHNYSNKAVSLDAWKLSSKKHYEKYIFPTKTNIPANGYLVICEDTNLFKTIYPNVNNFIGSTEFSWDNKRDSIKLVNAFDELQLVAIYSDSLPYPECADGWGRTLELKSNSSSLLEANSWLCGCVKGSPGKAYSPCQERISITEINHYDVPSPYNAGDWIEIKNNSSETINLGGYIFQDSKNSHSFTLPSYDLKANEYVVIINNHDEFTKQHSSITNFVGDFNFGLSSTKDVLRIYDNNDELITSVLYYNTNGWPIEPSNGNYTLELNSSYSANPNQAEAWFTGCFQGSPARAYSECLFLNPNEEMGIYPNPSNDYIWVVLNNKNNDLLDYTLQVFDLQGRIVYETTRSSNEKLVGSKLDVANYQNGLYHVRVKLKDEMIQKPFVKF